MILIALTLGLLSFAPQQTLTLDANETAIQVALGQLNSQQTLFLQLQGSVTFHGNTTPIVTNLSFNSFLGGPSGTYLTDQVEMETWVNGVLQKRLVGDGKTFWSYDLKNHVYSATLYGGTNSAARPTNYVTDLLNNINWAATGNDAYLTKLLRQIYNPIDASSSSTTTNPNLTDPNYNPQLIRYTSWMPGIASQDLLPPNAVTDPINSQLQYSPTPADSFYLYNGSPKRTIAFEVLQGTAGAGGTVPPVTLQTIYFNQLDTIAHFQRLTSWQIKPYTGITFAASLFQPYTALQTQGWHSIVPPRPVSD